MQDANGAYYYPDPTDTRSRVYVRRGSEDIEFRLWHMDYPDVWERHGWVAHATLQALAAVYEEQSPGRSPLALYDLNVAKALLKGRERGSDV